MKRLRPAIAIYPEGRCGFSLRILRPGRFTCGYRRQLVGRAMKRQREPRDVLTVAKQPVPPSSWIMRQRRAPCPATDALKFRQSNRVCRGLSEAKKVWRLEG